jgi:hypothetical protein
MTSVYQGREFECFYDQDSGAVFSDIEFRRCHFVSSALSITRDPALRSTIRNIKLLNCSQQGCSLDAAIVEDVLVDGFETKGQLFQVWGAVFNRVVLRGNIGRLMISPVVDLMGEHPESQKAFDHANAQYYRNIEWALDISQASFKELDLRCIPARLIRRDPETQVVVTRDKALLGKWRDLPLKEGLWKTSLNLFLEDNSPDIVLVAPKRARKFRDYLADLKTLQATGIAEPN